MESLFYNFLSFPAAIVGALTEAVKSVCSDNERRNVFQDGTLRLDGVTCILYILEKVVLKRSLKGPVL